MNRSEEPRGEFANRVGDLSGKLASETTVTL